MVYRGLQRVLEGRGQRAGGGGGLSAVQPQRKPVRYSPVSILDKRESRVCCGGMGGVGAHFVQWSVVRVEDGQAEEEWVGWWLHGGWSASLVILEDWEGSPRRNPE